MATTPGERLRALRDRLGWSLYRVAQQSGGKLDRARIKRMEDGVLKLGSVEARAGLAMAYQVTRSDLDDYLEGRLALDGLLLKSGIRDIPPQVTYRKDTHGDDARVALPRNSDQSVHGPETRAQQMGRALEIRRIEESEFPNLYRCMDYFAHLKKPKFWRPATVRAAEGGFAGNKQDLSVDEWAEVLDRIEQLHSDLAVEVTGHAPSAPRMVTARPALPDGHGDD